MQTLFLNVQDIQFLFINIFHGYVNVKEAFHFIIRIFS